MTAPARNAASTAPAVKRPAAAQPAPESATNAGAALAASSPGSRARVFLVAVRTESESNAREHWAVKAKRQAGIRDAVWAKLLGYPPPALPCVVTLTRVAPRELDDDNLRTALKAARDQAAVWLGLPLAKRRGRAVADDRDPRVSWAYAQRRGDVRQYAVEIAAAPREVSP